MSTLTTIWKSSECELRKFNISSGIPSTLPLQKASSLGTSPPGIRTAMLRTENSCRGWWGLHYGSPGQHCPGCLHQAMQDQSRKDFKGSHTTQQQTVLGTVVWKTPPQPHGQGWDEALNEELLSSSHQNTELITMNTLQLTFSLTHTTTCLPQIPYIHRYIHTYSYVYFCMLLFCLHSP